METKDVARRCFNCRFYVSIDRCGLTKKRIKMCNACDKHAFVYEVESKCK